MTPRAHAFLFQYHGGGRGTYGNPECPSSLREPPPDVTDGNIAQTNNDHTVLGLRASTSRCYTASGISAPGSISGISCCSSISAAAPRRRACKCRRQITDRSCGLKMRSRSRKPGRSKNGCIRRDRDDDRRFEALSRPVSRPGRGSRILAWDCRKPSNFSALSISRRR